MTTTQLLCGELAALSLIIDELAQRRRRGEIGSLRAELDEIADHLDTLADDLPLGLMAMSSVLAGRCAALRRSIAN